jgi:endonuclease/exonuclease/phosphatase (EEP) superfamily protein YafD
MTLQVSLLIACLSLASTACAQTLRIATYNLNWTNSRSKAVLDAITTAAPDLICFQETTVQSERFLRQRLSKTHPHFYAAGHEGKYAAERFAFASRTELVDVTFVPPSAGLFGFYTARLEFAGQTIHVVNVHLTPVLMKRSGGIGEALAAISRTEVRHEREIAAVGDTIDCQHPTIVVGDFNSISMFKAPRRLCELGMIDAFASVRDDADAHPTWTFPTRPFPLSLRIDYIFHTRHLTTTESEIIRREGSDHSLVVAELKWGESTDANGTAKPCVTPYASEESSTAEFAEDAE